MNNINQKLYKAILLLDTGRENEAVELLKRIAEGDCESLNDNILKVKAMCLLGDYLFSKGLYEQAKRYLENVRDIDISDKNYDNDLLDEEKKTARNLLSKIYKIEK